MCIIEPGFFKTAVTSLDPLEKELHRLWNQLSPEVQASYGDKYLDKCKYCSALFGFIMQTVCKCHFTGLLPPLRRLCSRCHLLVCLWVGLCVCQQDNGKIPGLIFIKRGGRV